MKITFDFSDIESMVNVNEIEDEAVEVMEDTITDIYTDLVAPPPLGTPVDLNTARNGWQIDLGDRLHPEVYNTVHYINRLNDGHSKQSPAGFIDAIVDKHVR